MSEFRNAGDGGGGVERPEGHDLPAEATDGRETHDVGASARARRVENDRPEPLSLHEVLAMESGPERNAELEKVVREAAQTDPETTLSALTLRFADGRPSDPKEIDLRVEASRALAHYEHPDVAIAALRDLRSWEGSSDDVDKVDSVFRAAALDMVDKGFVEHGKRCIAEIRDSNIADSACEEVVETWWSRGSATPNNIDVQTVRGIVRQHSDGSWKDRWQDDETFRGIALTAAKNDRARYAIAALEEIGDSSVMRRACGDIIGMASRGEITEGGPDEPDVLTEARKRHSSDWEQEVAQNGGDEAVANFLREPGITGDLPEDVVRACRKTARENASDAVHEVIEEIDDTIVLIGDRENTGVYEAQLAGLVGGAVGFSEVGRPKAGRWVADIIPDADLREAVHRLVDRVTPER